MNDVRFQSQPRRVPTSVTAALRKRRRLRKLLKLQEIIRYERQEVEFRVNYLCQPLLMNGRAKRWVDVRTGVDKRTSGRAWTRGRSDGRGQEDVRTGVDKRTFGRAWTRGRSDGRWQEDVRTGVDKRTFERAWTRGRSYERGQEDVQTGMNKRTFGRASAAKWIGNIF